MDSISSGQVADVLARLHREADAADAALMASYTSENGEDLIAQLMEAEKHDLKGFYRGFADNFLAISPEFGRFIYMCARACRAKHVVEFGSSMGISAIYLAAAVRDNGGGRVIGTDLEATKIERARRHIAEAGLGDITELRLGDARETLASGIDDIDMVMLDGAFSLYLPILKLLEPHLRPGAIVIGENAFDSAPGYFEYVRDPRNGYLSRALPFDPNRGNELTIRT